MTPCSPEPQDDHRRDVLERERLDAQLRHSAELLLVRWADENAEAKRERGRRDRGVDPRRDLIVVLEHGRVVEQGTHEELIARRGLYTSLYGDWADEVA